MAEDFTVFISGSVGLLCEFGYSFSLWELRRSDGLRFKDLDYINDSLSLTVIQVKGGEAPILTEVREVMVKRLIRQLNKTGSRGISDFVWNGALASLFFL